VTCAGNRTTSGRRRPRAPLAAAAVLASAVLTACGTGAGGGQSDTTQASKPVDDKTPVTLHVLSAEGGSVGRLKAYDEINAAFEQQHPNVTVKQTTKAFSDLVATIKLQLSDDSPIDVVQTNQGYYTMGALVKAKLLRPLDADAQRLGWTERQPESLLDMTRLSDDGQRLGEGKLYGIAATGDAVGVYYNRDKLKTLGLDVPSTMDQFEAALAKAKAAGETPIKFGNLDKWPGVNEFQTVMNAKTPAEQVRELIFGSGGQSFDSPAVTQSAATVQAWVEKGYFEQNANGISYDDAWKRFAKGDGVFLIGGTWLNADLGPAMGDKAGFFLAPGATAQETATSASGGFPWGIPAKSRYPDLAAQYIDFVTGPKAAKILVRHGDVPSLGMPADIADGTTADALAAWQTLKDRDAFIPYVDWSTPTMNDTMTAAIQELFARRVSPAQFAERLQQDYAKFEQSR
jgi:raffinose/stachyose/melibiose transport system substrate-binding protein